MENLLTKAGGLLLIAALGHLLRRAGVFRAKDARVLSRIIIHLTLPGALISSFASFVFKPDMLVLIVVAAAANFLLLLLSTALSRKKSAPLRALYMLNMPSYNIGTFVLPFVQSFLHAEGLLATSIFDVGNCPMNSGISYAVTAAALRGERIRLSVVMRNMFSSVPFLTFLSMMLVAALGLQLPAPIYTIANMFGQANVFLAMLMIGIMLDIHIARDDRADVCRIVLWRYGVNAALAAACYLLLPLPLIMRQVLVLSLLAPVPSVTLAYCDKCKCSPALVSAVHSLCIPISLLCTLLALFIWQ